VVCDTDTEDDEAGGPRKVGSPDRKALGLTRGQVLGKMHRLGLKTKNPPKKWLNTATVEKMTELAGQRLSANQIGKALGLTRGQVRYRMGQLGLKTNPRTEWPAEAAQKMTELINRGLSNRGNCQGTWTNSRSSNKHAASSRPQDEERSQLQKRPAAESGTVESGSLMIVQFHGVPSVDPGNFTSSGSCRREGCRLSSCGSVYLTPR
jgi:hypothetical protein